ncbi:AEC family transporter [Permianibacter fluminis]|uniref:AEC family transporter n=1 Tax=Permianibacter fluminis TaxID=2738515 RepID=UPI001B7D7A91|nr:AEC family transporter [Permianibacter fluminis]
MLVENLLLIAICLAIGVILRISRRVGDDVAHALNAYVIHVALPAVVLHQVPAMQFTAQLLFPALLPWLLLAVSAGAVLLLARYCQWSKAITGALLLVVPLGNTSFLGFPLVQSFWGEAGLPVAIIYDQLGSFVALSTYGIWILSRYADCPPPTVKRVLERMVHFTPFLALLAGLLLSQITVPVVLDDVFKRIGATLVPVILVAVGLQWKLDLHAELRAPLALGLSLKLLAMPLLALALVQVLGVHGLTAQVSVFEAGMASMITAGALAMNANLAPRLAAAMVGFGIPLSLLTLTLWHSLLQ